MTAFLFVCLALLIAYILSEISIKLQHAWEDRRRADVLAGSVEPIYDWLVHEWDDVPDLPDPYAAVEQWLA